LILKNISILKKLIGFSLPALPLAGELYHFDNLILSRSFVSSPLCNMSTKEKFTVVLPNSQADNTAAQWATGRATVVKFRSL
jgi:hypothetical protein